jgi:hypothetical protein
MPSSTLTLKECSESSLKGLGYSLASEHSYAMKNARVIEDGSEYAFQTPVSETDPDLESTQHIVGGAPIHLHACTRN